MQVVSNAHKGLITELPLQLIDRAIQVGWLILAGHTIDIIKDVLIISLEVFNSTITSAQLTAATAATTLQYGFASSALVKLFSFF